MEENMQETKKNRAEMQPREVLFISMKNAKRLSSTANRNIKAMIHRECDESEGAKLQKYYHESVVGDLLEENKKLTDAIKAFISMLDELENEIISITERSAE